MRTNNPVASSSSNRPRNIVSDIENFLIEVEKNKDQVIPVIPITASYYRDKFSYFKEQLRKQRLYSNQTATLLLPSSISDDHSSTTTFQQQHSTTTSPFNTPSKQQRFVGAGIGNGPVTIKKKQGENNNNNSGAGSNGNNSEFEYFDEKWSLYREYITLQKQIEEVQQQDSDLNYIEMRRRVDLAQVFREHGEFSEAFIQLEHVEQLAQQKAESGEFNPKVELLHAKCLFLLSIVLKQKNRVDDAAEYLESSKERTDYLLKVVSPANNHKDQCTNFVFKSARLLLSEISLYSSEDLIFQQQKNFQSLPLGQKLTINEENNIEKILSEYLIPGLQNVKIVSGQSQKVTVSNLEVFRNLCYYSAVCMMMLRENSLSKQLLSVAESTSPLKANNNGKNRSNNNNNTDIYLEANVEIDKKISKLAIDIKIAEEKIEKEKQQASTSQKHTSKSHNSKLKFKDDSDESDDDDEWDDFVPTGALSGLAKLILGDGNEEEEVDEDPISTDIFPSKYRLFKSRTYKEEDDKLPQCILTDSLVNPIGVSPMSPACSNTFSNREEFKKWIQLLNALPTNPNPYTQNVPITIFGYSINDRLQMNGNQLCSLYDKLIQSEAFTSKWIKVYYELCTRLYNVSSMEMMISQQQTEVSQQALSLQQKCAQMLLNYFNLLKQHKTKHSMSASVMSMSNVVGADQQTNQQDIMAKLNDISDKLVEKKTFLFTVSMEMFSIAGRLFHPEEEEIKFIVGVMKEWFGSQVMYIQLAKLQATIRFHMRLFRYDCMMPMKEEIRKVYDDLLNLFDNIESAESLPTADSPQPNTANHRSSARNNQAYNIEKYYSPNLSTVAAKVIILFHRYHNFWVTSLRRGGSEDEWSYMPELPRHKLLSDKERFSLLLRKYYPKIPLCHLKAEVAYTVGSFWLRQPKSKDDRQLAECVLFECIYMYYKLSQSVQSFGFSFMLTNDAMKALKKFSEVLYANDKYEYSSLCYEVYVNNYKMLRGRHDYQFIDDLTSVTTKHNDYKHSVKYYAILYEKAKEEKKIPQIARLSTKLANLYMEKGEVLEAERIKLESIDYAKRYGTLMDYKTDLEIELGTLLLQGGKFEKCIAVLYSVAQEQANKRHIVYEILSRAYLKKRWFAECEDSLTEIANVLVNFYIQLNQQQEMRILETVSKYYFKRSMFGYALECVNIALYRCSGTFAVLANLFKLKGKILKAICQYSTRLTFPCSISESTEEELHQLVTQIEQTPSNRNNLYEGINENDCSFVFSKRPTYYCIAQLLQDCIDCFTKAAGYYEACSNQIGEAKVNLLISETLLDYLFVPISLLGKDPEPYIKLKEQSEENRKKNGDVQHNQFKAIAPLDYLDLNTIFSKHIEAALETSVAACDVFLCMYSYITSAECKYLQGKISSAKSFWCECRDVLFTLFIDSDSHVILLAGTPLGVIEKLMIIVKRMVRLLFCFEPEFVNQHLGIFDVYYVIDIQYEQAAKRLPTFDAESEYVDKDQQHPLSLEYYTNYFYSNLDKIIGNNKQLSEADKQLLTKNKLFEILQKRVTATSSTYLIPSLPTSFSSSSLSTLTTLRKGTLKKSASISSGSSNEKSSEGSLGSATISQFLDVPSTTTMHNNSKKSTPPAEFIKPNMTQLKQKILERVFGCILTMKQDSKKYSNEIHDRLKARNQECMRRLYNLMNAIRESGISISKHKKGKKGASTINFSNEAPLSPLFAKSPHIVSPKQRERSMSIDTGNSGGTLMTMDLLPGDVELMEMLIRTVNLQKGTKLKGTIQQTMNIHLILERNIARYTSISPDITCLEENFKIVQKMKLMDQLVYVFYIDSVLIFYIPKEGRKVVIPFGGRDHAVLDDKIRNVIDLNESPATPRHGQSDSVDFLSNKVTNWSTKDLGKDLTLIDDYLLTLITRSAREKKAKKFTHEDMVKGLHKVLNAHSIFSYKPDVAKFEEFRKSISDLNFSFKQLYTQKTGTLSGTLSSTFGRKRSISSIPKLDQLPNFENHIILLCNSFLNVIPWELLFEVSLTRVNAIQYFIGRIKKKKSSEKKISRFVTFFSEDEAKFILPAEQERKEWIFEDIQCKLNFRRSKTAGRIHKDLQDIPFHTPIIKNGKKPSKSSYKKKYEYVSFIELSSIVNAQNSNLIRILQEKVGKDEFPVFLFTWSDLSNLSNTIHFIFLSIPDCSLLFVPEMDMKKCVKYLMMLLETYMPQLCSSSSPKTLNIPTTMNGGLVGGASTNSDSSIPPERRNLHKFLLFATKILKDEFEIPTALFFPPSLYTKPTKKKPSAGASSSAFFDTSPKR